MLKKKIASSGYNGRPKFPKAFRVRVVHQALELRGAGIKLNSNRRMELGNEVSAPVPGLGWGVGGLLIIVGGGDGMCVRRGRDQVIEGRREGARGA